eukprot:3553796-Amphidinium_carterae.1
MKSTRSQGRQRGNARTGRWWLWKAAWAARQRQAAVGGPKKAQEDSTLREGKGGGESARDSDSAAAWPVQ